MNKFIVVNGLPYLLSHGKAYAVRWDDEGFTVGTEVNIASVPAITYSELSIKAKCADLDSIKEAEPETEKPLSEMTLEELKAYAKAHGVKLGNARTKKAVIDAIADAFI